MDALAPEDDKTSATGAEIVAETPQPQVPAWNVTEIINDAYLRTVSRFPDPEELTTAQTYIVESKDPVDGVRGVLWALLNTREFMVNH